MSTSEAWLVEYDRNLAIALGDHAMVELVQGGSTFPIPGTPEHCSSVCLWHSRIIPIMDIRTILGLDNDSGQESSYLCIIRYRSHHDKPIRQFALRINQAPRRIQVDDAQACDVPETFRSNLLGEVIISCFEHDKRPVLILDINKLCSTEFLNLAIAA